MIVAAEKDKRTNVLSYSQFLRVIEVIAAAIYPEVRTSVLCVCVWLSA